MRNCIQEQETPRKDCLSEDLLIQFSIIDCFILLNLFLDFLLNIQ